jgi:hypothetical protein
MFKEIAVDPAAVTTSYRDFSYLVEKFGISEGRLIAAFPSKWKKYVFEAAQRRLHGIELKRIVERLNSLTKDCFLSRGRPGEGCADDWLAAAIAEHKRQPFDAIIAAAADLEGIAVLAPDLDATHPCLLPNRQWHIERTPEIMARCCSPLLSSASHVKLIDPHFDANNARHRRPLVEFLKCIKSGARVDIFSGDRKDEAHLRLGIERALLEVRPDGVEVRLHLRPQATLHNRYVLTQGGGMFFSTGLDDHDGGEVLTDEVGVLDPAIWSVQWEKYSGDDSVACWR